MATALVTGANRGIGLELCRLLQARGDQVIGACREASEGLSALGVRVEEGVDVTSGDAIEALRGRLDADGLRLDLLVNNAGILLYQSLDQIDYDQMRRQYEVNALGPLRVTAGLVSLLNEGAKVGLVTSRMGSIEDNTSGGHYGYRASKAALNAIGKSLSHDLRRRGIAVAILHPGWVKTDMTRGSGNVGPDEAAAGLLARLDELSLETSGTFWHANGETLPW